MKVKMPTIKDVATLSGVSISTVSIVLNSKPEERKVAPQTYEKVTNAITILGYQPNMAARRLRSSESNKPTISLYWPLDYRASFLVNILIGIREETKRLNYDCDIVVSAYENDKLSAESGILSKNKFSAAIIGGTSYKDMEYLENIKPQMPIILFNRNSDKYFTVCNDNDDAAYKAAKLFAVKGHKRAAIITVETPFLAMNIRTKSFISACKELDIEIEDIFIIKSENSYEGGVLAAKKFLTLENRPHALFCDSDFLALGAAHIFNKEGTHIPEDLEIIAIGMLSPDTTAYSTPPITVVSLPSKKMAADCMNIIYNILKNNITEPVHKVHESKLLFRDSCRP
ncbi:MULTISPECIES: LacI family DNA-binding transcriptional regulator [Clostridium]|uniref:LacI family DNA-binding transcriptional regulator n=1 Tax=Clostridium frigoriphilum TaxID=443253 RepID=A0ABU7UVE1_9CLOT|nr:LacI family DNA-binding transcriptional regulator [Clostridium sp. DSM 17811]MBU3102444.1 LacI family transcriptional regulator [Clostridium sp. DSM 17811]